MHFLVASTSFGGSIDIALFGVLLGLEGSLFDVHVLLRVADVDVGCRNLRDTVLTAELGVGYSLVNICELFAWSLHVIL